MKTIVSIILLYTFVISLQAQKTIEGVSIPESYTAGSNKLVLNGAGVREKYFFNLYVAALYLKSRSQDAQTIINSEDPSAIKIHILSGMITKEKMDESIREGFKKATGGNTAPYQGKIDAFVKALSEDIGKGAVYEISYYPEGKSVKVYKDGKFKTEIQGLDFKKILLAIWLGKDPVDHDLKKDLLGK